MLQRLVRSTVKTAPRPYRTVLDPCLCRPSSLCGAISRPGKFFSIQARKRESMAIRSSQVPWMGHSFTIHTWPSRSIICALISPTFSLIRSRQSLWPAIIASRASFTQAGQRESVCRGKPSVGLVFSQDFSSGLSDHLGVTEGFGLRLLKYWMVSKVIPAVLQTIQSNVLATCVPAVFGINLYPPLSRNTYHMAFELDEAHSIVRYRTRNDCPRAHLCVHKKRTTNTRYVQ